MFRTFLSAASLIALTVSLPAHADTTASAGVSAQVERTQNQNDNSVVTEEELKEGWENTKKAVSETVQEVSESTQDAIEELKAALVEKDYSGDNAKIETITYNKHNTATGIIGQAVYNSKNESVGRVHDIILDSNGKAEMLIIADGDLLGMGKKVAINYDLVSMNPADGAVIAPLTEEAISKARVFSYDAKDAAADTVVMPAGYQSINTLLSAQLLDSQDKPVGEIDNIIFNKGTADQIVVGFNKVLNMGGDKVALSYNKTDLIKNGEETDFRLTSNQSVQLEAYKEIVN